jgi:hypothetical protein
MPANLITLAHFSISFAISLPKSAGVIDIGAAPLFRIEVLNKEINAGSDRR